ncbi:hypothetical protein SCG7109_AL_00100 [Chlamydiales bacterium SCGC AG-110-M15]|nr:hypothetical protein SCG7109_AL_00100 [Chlamydiales bacterium SCGC AG-110-M15]
MERTSGRLNAKSAKKAKIREDRRRGSLHYKGMQEQIKIGMSIRFYKVQKTLIAYLRFLRALRVQKENPAVNDGVVWEGASPPLPK